MAISLPNARSLAEELAENFREAVEGDGINSELSLEGAEIDVKVIGGSSVFLEGKAIDRDDLDPDAAGERVVAEIDVERIDYRDGTPTLFVDVNREIVGADPVHSWRHERTISPFCELGEENLLLEVFEIDRVS